MAENPYYIQPMGGYGPSIVQGLTGIAQRFGDERRLEQQQQAQQAKQAAMQQELMQAYQSQDPNQVAQVMFKYPEASKVFDSAIGFRDQATANNMVASAREILANPDRAEQILQSRIAMVEARGGDATETREALEEYRTDPQGFIRSAEMVLASKDPEAFEAYKSATAAPETDLTADMKGYRLAKQEGFEGSFIDYKNAVSGRGEKTALEMMKLQTQIMDIQDRLSQRQLDREASKSLKDKKDKTLVQGINSVLEEIGRAKKEAKGFMATGVGGALTGEIPGTPAKKLRATVGTIKANIGFDRLQQMRDMSPTGGALGQVAVQELNALQSVITSLDPDMGEERLVEALDKIEEHYSNWKATLVAEDKGIDEGAEVENTAMTARDREAMEWARQNPNDPRATRIMQMLEAR